MITEARGNIAKTRPIPSSSRLKSRSLTDRMGSMKQIWKYEKNPDIKASKKPGVIIKSNTFRLLFECERIPVFSLNESWGLVSDILSEIFTELGRMKYIIGAIIKKVTPIVMNASSYPNLWYRNIPTTGPRQRPISWNIVIIPRYFSFWCENTIETVEIRAVWIIDELNPWQVLQTMASMKNVLLSLVWTIRDIDTVDSPISIIPTINICFLPNFVNTGPKIRDVKIPIIANTANIHPNKLSGMSLLFHF